MHPVAVYGGSDKARQTFAEDFAQENNYLFCAVEAKDVLNYSRAYITSNFENRKTVFYIYDCHAITYDKMIEFLSMIKSSTNFFVLSYPYSSAIKGDLKRYFTLKSLGDSKSAFSSELQELMVNKDRDAVRVNISDADAQHIFHTLKGNAWQIPTSNNALLDISQYLYKVKEGYLLSLLAYAFPARMYNTYNIKARKSESKEMQGQILTKLKTAYCLNPEATADLYVLIKTTHVVPENVGLSEDERAFLGIKNVTQAPPKTTFTQSLEAFW